MRSFDKANCRQGVVSELSPHLVSGQGRARNIWEQLHQMCSWPNTIPRTIPGPVPFLLSSSILVCVFRSSRAGRSEGFIEWRGKGQAVRILSTSSHRIVVRTKLNFSASVMNNSKTRWYLRCIRCSQRESLVRLWPHGCHARAPDPGTDMARTPLTLLAWAGQCFTLLTDTWCQLWAGLARDQGVFLPPF